MTDDADEFGSISDFFHERAAKSRSWADTLYPGQHYMRADFDQIVGQNVARFRKAMGLSQADLAASISGEDDVIHQQTVQKIEKGTRPLKYSEAIRICTALHITPVQLGDLPAHAQSNAHFQRAINDVSEAQAKLLDVVGQELVNHLIALAELVGLARAGEKGHQPDPYLIEYAEKLLRANWGMLLNEAILVDIHTRYTRGDELSAQIAEAASPASAFEKVAERTMSMTRTDDSPSIEDNNDEPDA
ncbi:helix-turn-helix domain-containing protein [Mycolicibacterium pulveris]|uniref:helix-turn-helix domain-containing protein n=1 Tax=Mycolicibacterium pulveris TaxID=36813 RepID=UPI003CEF4CD9